MLKLVIQKPLKAILGIITKIKDVCNLLKQKSMPKQGIQEAFLYINKKRIIWELNFMTQKKQ